MKNYSELIISNLFKFKKLPSVSSERQIGLLLTPFLEQIFEEYILFAVELPIKKDDTNQSKKIDFAMKSKTKNELLLIELKTDRDMFDAKQLEFYTDSNNKNIQWKDVFSKIKNIVAKGNMDPYRRMKYYNLYLTIKENGLISTNDDEINVLIQKIENTANCIDNKSLSERSKNIKMLFNKSTPKDYLTNLLYLIPNDENTISCLSKVNIGFKTFDQLPTVIDYREEYATLISHLKEI